MTFADFMNKEPENNVKRFSQDSTTTILSEKAPAQSRPRQSAKTSFKARLTSVPLGIIKEEVIDEENLISNRAVETLESQEVQAKTKTVKRKMKVNFAQFLDNQASAQVHDFDMDQRASEIHRSSEELHNKLGANLNTVEIQRENVTQIVETTVEDPFKKEVIVKEMKKKMKINFGDFMNNLESGELKTFEDAKRASVMMETHNT